MCSTGLNSGLTIICYVKYIHKASCILHDIICTEDTTLTANLKDLSVKGREKLENKLN